STEYDLQLPPRMAQFRLDLRMIIERLAVLLGNKELGKKTVSWLMLRAWRWMLAAADVMVISAILQISLALPMAIYFHRAMTLGLPTNMIVVPLHGILLPVAGLALGLACIWPPLARLPAALAVLVVHGTNYVVEGLARFHIHSIAVGDIRVADPSGWMAAFVAASVVFAMLAPRWAAAGTRRERILTLASLLLLIGGAGALLIP